MGNMLKDQLSLMRFVLIVSVSLLTSGSIVSANIKEILISPIKQFGGIDIDAELQLNRPADFLVLNNKIVVSDSDDDCLVVFDKDWRLLSRLGKRGQGPGEFIGPKKLGVLDDNLIVTDTQNSRIQIIALTGECLATYPAPALVSINVRLWYASDGTYYFNSEGYLSENLVIQKTLAGEDIRGYGKIYGKRMSRIVFGGELMKKGEVPDWYKNKTFPICNNDEELYCIHTALPIVKKFRKDGTLVFEKTYDFSEMESIRSRWIKANKDAPPKGSYGLAYWRDVDIDDEGTLYLLANNPGKMTIYRLDEDGEVTTRYLGVEDKITMIHVYKQELWAFGGDSHIFYKYSLKN
jgi:hypothetical protein